MVKVATEKNVVDILIKSLPSIKFHHCLGILKVIAVIDEEP